MGVLYIMLEVDSCMRFYNTTIHLAIKTGICILHSHCSLPHSVLRNIVVEEFPAIYYGLNNEPLRVQVLIKQKQSYTRHCYMMHTRKRYLHDAFSSNYLTTLV